MSLINHDVLVVSHSRSSLPPELWEICFSLCSKRQLRRLLRVCKLFQRISRTLIFRTRHFNAPRSLAPSLMDDMTRRRWRRITPDLESQHQELVRFACSPFSVGVVRACSWEDPVAGIRDHVHDNDDEDDVDIARARLMAALTAKVFSRVFPTYGTGLRDISLSRVVLTAGIRAHLERCAQLDALRLYRCTLETPGPLIVPRLREFVFSSGQDRHRPLQEDTDSMKVSCYDQLTSLTIRLYHHTGHVLLSYIALFTSLNSVLAPYDALTHLTMPFVPTDQFDLMYTFIQKCPNLESLTITPGRYDSAEVPPGTQPLSLPHLTSYEGSLLLAGVFIPGNPVRKIHVGVNFQLEVHTPLEKTVHALECAAKSTGVVEALVVGVATEVSVELFEKVCEWFPKLKKLVFFAGEDAERVGEQDIGFTVGNTAVVGAHDDEDQDMEGQESESEEEEEESEPDSDTSDASVYSEEYVPSYEEQKQLDVFNIPEELSNSVNIDIPPIKVDDSGHPLKSLDSFAGFIEWLCTGHIPLPPLLETLHLCQFYLPDVRFYEYPVPARKRALVELARRLRCLKKFACQTGMTWRKVEGEEGEEGVWVQMN